DRTTGQGCGRFASDSTQSPEESKTPARVQPPTRKPAPARRPIYHTAAAAPRTRCPCPAESRRYLTRPPTITVSARPRSSQPANGVLALLEKNRVGSTVQ